MAEKFQVTKADPGSSGNIEEFGREYSDKLQSLGKQMISSLYMLVRSVKLYDPENAIFIKPLEVLKDTINTIIASDNQLVLQAMAESFYLNNMLVKTDLNSLDNVRQLVAEFQERGVGGFVLQHPINIDELRNFVWIFSTNTEEEAGEEGLSSRKLVNIKVSKWKKIKEKLKDDDDSSVDRKKYAVTVYARAIFYMRTYLDRMREGKALSLRTADRFVQDLVDICFEQRTHFLGMTTLDKEQDYLVYHSVNTCLISIVFASELGMSKAQLKELGVIALFHDVGMAAISPELMSKKGALSQQEKAEIDRAPLRAVEDILSRGGLSRTEVARLVTTIEHHEDFGRPVKDSKGNIQMIIPRSNLAVYSKILSITNTYDALTSNRPFRDAYGPEIALMLMWTEMRHKFDPELLQVFMEVMKIQPVRILPKGKRTVTMG